MCALHFNFNCNISLPVSLFCWIVYLFPHPRKRCLLFRTLQPSPARSEPGNLELERKSLSRRIHLSNLKASHFTASSLKSCLMRCSKWRIALVDQHHTILCQRFVCFSWVSVRIHLLLRYLGTCVCVRVCVWVSERERDRCLSYYWSEELKKVLEKDHRHIKAERIVQNAIFLSTSFTYLYLFFFLQL